ncbi:Cytosolic copper metallochaperone [Diatrype stigma]|uniref:Cytosolic copper metallochaperone n=1 Tax=Diatrype stigma TaxID=117547 RepID=A0AAN9YLZ7_9PEZI
MSTHTYKFDVSMSCNGCSGAVDRVLKKLEGVESYDVSLQDQQARVVAGPDLDYETILRTIKKTGKKVNGAREVVEGNPDGVVKSVELAD